MDTGQIYRYISLIVSGETNINPDYEKLSKNDEEEVLDRSVNKLEENKKRNQEFKNLQSEESIERDSFEWMLNPFLEVINLYIDKNLDQLLEGKDYISKTDLKYQVLIKMSSYQINELFEGDISLLESINDDIAVRKDNYKSLLKSLVDEKTILNTSLINEEIINQTNRLSGLYSDNFTKQIMETLNSYENKDKVSLDNIIYKKVSKEVSKFLAENCHYLHTYREDEFAAYGAFVEGETLPIAWASFSKQDREYKEQMLHYLGVEPQNTLEMTRAWCSNSAPQNIMSSLFQNSINEVEKEWNKLAEEGKVDKKLQAITTTINPNLGFMASSFLGANFIPFALRPAKFTYAKEDSSVEYMTRREIESKNLSFIENQFNILPLNEIIHPLDKRKKDEIAKNNIYIMNKDSYERVLSKQRIGEKDGKNIDSDEKQR